MSNALPGANITGANSKRNALLLTALLLALSVLYAFWFRDDRHRIAAWLVFALPPLLLALGSLLKRTSAHFWAGVFALGWFSHGVMVAYSRPGERAVAVVATVLALLVIWAANAPALRARFAKRR